jgi:DHA2 family multidrug resistance protein-like MFS transporter
VLSAALSMAAIVPLIFAVKHVAGHGLDVVTVGCLAAGVAAGVLFVRRQRRLEQPMLDVELFRSPAFSGAVAANVIAIFALTGLLFFFSQYLQLARGHGPLQAGLAELPATIASIAVVALIGVAVTRLGRGRAIALGMAMAAAGLALVAAAAHGPYLWLGLALVPIGLGIGLAMTLTGDAIISAAPPRKAGSVSAITETANELGVVLGIAVLGSLVSLVYRSRVEVPAGLTADETARVRDSLGPALQVLEPGSAAAAGARDAFIAGMQATSVVAAVLTFGAAVVAWRLIPSPRAARP